MASNPPASVVDPLDRSNVFAPQATLPRLSTRSRLRLRRLAVSRLRARHATRLIQPSFAVLNQRLQRVELSRLRADRADRLFRWLVSTSPASAPTSPALQPTELVLTSPASAPTSPALQLTELALTFPILVPRGGGGGGGG